MSCSTVSENGGNKRKSAPFCTQNAPTSPNRNIPGDRYGYYLTLGDMLYDLEMIEKAIQTKISDRGMNDN